MATSFPTTMAPAVHPRGQEVHGPVTVVSANEFRRLAISNRRFVRADVPQKGWKGLRDAESGEWYVTPSQDLFR
ncbi:MAG: hypothetical protein FJ297_05165 [Planctomycetes bacterium]|nr:hypothetical protein [Planctomycetota bacterium]